MANPKALIYFSSVFLWPSVPCKLIRAIFLVILGIYRKPALVCSCCCYFSMRKMNTYYQKFAKWIDGITGGIFISFGCLLILTGIKLVDSIKKHLNIGAF